MRKVIVLVMAAGLLLPGLCWANNFEFGLAAGSTSVAADFQYKSRLRTGFLKTGLGLVNTDDDDTEYRWLDLNLMVGSETFAPGLTMEVGLNGIFGDAEEDGLEGDVGAIAFAGRIGYVLPRQVMPIPLEFFGALAYAPNALSFRDTDTYVSYSLGAGVRVVPNATIFLEYADYEVDFETDSGDWEFDDDVVRLGLRMRF